MGADILWYCKVSYVSGNVGKYVLENDVKAKNLKNKLSNYRQNNNNPLFLELEHLNLTINLLNVENITISTEA